MSDSKPNVDDEEIQGIHKLDNPQTPPSSVNS